MKKKKLWLAAVIFGVWLGLCACGKEVQMEQAEIQEPCREWIRTGSLEQLTISLKVPEKYLIYEDMVVSGELRNELISTSLYVNDGTDPEIEEVLYVSVYEKPGRNNGQNEFEYVTDSQKDYYNFELIEEKEEDDIKMLFIEGVDKDSEYESLSNKLRIAAGFITVDDYVFSCQVSCMYLHKEEEEKVGFKELEQIVKDVVIEVLPYEGLQPEEKGTESTESSRVEPEESVESSQAEKAEIVESTESSTESGGESQAEIEGVAVYETPEYPQDDWRSGGLYYNGTYFQVPMSYQELCDLGFNRLGNNGMDNIDEISDESKAHYMLPAYSCNLAITLNAYNEEDKWLNVSFVNETGEEQWIKDCTIYEIRFSDDVMEENLGDSIQLCNGITHMSTYEEVIELMGEPSYESGSKDENGYFGTMTYQIEGVGDHRVSIHFFRNQVDGFTVTMMPIDAHILTRV